MKSVISASRRTDIPAFYLNWFMNAIKTGQIEVTNPFYKQNTRIIRLDPDHVRWIVFWSRNYVHFIKSQDFFRDYNLFFHFTILPRSVMEKSGLPQDKALDQIRILAETYGPDHIIWRYDPIVHWIENKTIVSNHDLNKFEDLCRQIGKFGIKQCYFSFVHPYQKFEKRFARTFNHLKIHDLALNEKILMLNQMTEVSAKYNITLFSCCNNILLKSIKIQKGHCINGALLNHLNNSEKVSIAKYPSRQDCGCTRSIDIGDYLKHPCHYGCIYCYANPSGY